MKKLVIFHLILFFSISCNAFELVDSININAKCQGDRVYLNAEAIDISSHQICLVLKDYKNLPLTCLFSDNQGIYVLAKDFEQNIQDNFDNMAWCANCHTIREYGWDGRCKVCKLKIAPGF